MPETKVAITDDLILDFTGLFSESPPEAPESPVEPFLGAEGTGDREAAQKPVDWQINGLETQQAVGLYLKTQREREAEQRSLEVYKTYQENIKTSSQLQTDILKGVKAGEDVFSLFLKAAKAVSLMTSNTVFYSQIEADLTAIYGRGLLYKPPLQKELQEAQTRLQRLIEAEKRETQTDSRERIRSAIEAHKRTIAELGTMIEKTA